MATPAYGAQASTQAEPNNAALYESRRRQTVTGTQILDNIVSFSNCMSLRRNLISQIYVTKVPDLGAVQARADRVVVEQSIERKLIDCGNGL